MNILTMMDALHHFRTVTAYNALARYNILHSGYDPSLDAYVTKLRLAGRIEVILSKMTFADTKEVKAQPALPFSSTTPRQYHAKKKYRVWLPNGQVQKHADAKQLARALQHLRTNLLQMEQKKERIQRNKDNHALLKKMGMPIPHGVMKARIGRRPSPLVCDRAKEVVIENLRTGSIVLRPLMSFDTTGQWINSNGVSPTLSVH